MPPPPVAGAPVGILVSAGTGVWLERAGAVVTFGDAGARAVAGAEALALDVAVGLALDVAVGLVLDVAEALAAWRAVVAGEALVVPVCVLVDTGGE